MVGLGLRQARRRRPGLRPGVHSVDFGIHIGTRGCLTSRENVMSVARRAEALGYTHLGVAGHLQRDQKPPEPPLPKL
jgi:hypothetical protein